jgi:hypothetical protein
MDLCKLGHDRDVVGRYARGQCRACGRAAVDRYQAANPEMSRKSGRRKRGMIGLPAVEAAPGHLCECCLRPTQKQPHADHDHATGLFRGWLCQRCNLRLAAVDDRAWLASARDYLARHDARFYQHDEPWPNWPGFKERE